MDIAVWILRRDWPKLTAELLPQLAQKSMSRRFFRRAGWLTANSFFSVFKQRTPSQCGVERILA
jgi:hypothetical protein